MKKLLTVLPVAIAMLLISNPALAQDGAADAGGDKYLAAGLAIGLAAIGGALGQGNAAKGALEALGRNPKAAVFVPLLLSLALIESLVIYALVISFQILG